MSPVDDALPGVNGSAAVRAHPDVRVVRIERRITTLSSGVLRLRIRGYCGGVPWRTADARVSIEVRGKFAAMREDLRTRLWPLPVCAVMLALGLGVALPRVDAAIDDELAASVTAYLFGGGAGAARAVLGAIAGSLVSVTSLTFSLTVLTLQLASSQYSPRLLRTFARDRFVQVTLSLMLAAFTYALTVLRTVRSPDETRDVFVPQISVTVAFGLAVAAVLSLVLFLGHLAQMLRVESILRDVHGDASRTMHRVLSRYDGAKPAQAAPGPPREGAEPLLAPSSGFLLAVNEAALLLAAKEAGMVLRIERNVGDALVGHTPVGCAWPFADTAPDGKPSTTALQELVGRALTTGFERSGLNDVTFGLRQVTDVATKALSPGINDPTTAVHALNHSAALLCELLPLDLSPRVLIDTQGAARVVLCQPKFEDLLELAIRQPCHYGGKDPFVMAALLEVLHAVGWAAERSDHRNAVLHQCERLRAAVEAQDFVEEDQARLTALTHHVKAALNRS